MKIKFTMIDLKSWKMWIIVDWVESMENDFFRKGRYLLYPSVLEGFGLMPMEAAMQGTIPICSDIDILRYSSSPP